MKDHTSNNCRITKGEKCMKCGILGHFAKCCKTRSPKKAETHEVKANEIKKASSSDEESFLFKIGDNNRPVYSICVEDTVINMLIDSDQHSTSLMKLHIGSLEHCQNCKTAQAKYLHIQGKPH